MHSSIEELLLSIGIDGDYMPDISRTEILKIIENYEGIIIRSKTLIDKELLDCASKLEFIARAGAGLDKIDLEEIEIRGIQLYNAPEGNRDAVGEHVIGMILALLNNFVKGQMQIRNGIWDREGNRGYELSAQTVGIIGYGHMGKAVAQRLKAFGCDILAYDKYLTGFGDDIVEEADLEMLFERADIITMHTPLTQETMDMCNISFWKRFRKPIWYINSARGEISTFKSVLKGLSEGKLRGAALDVLENEKIEKLNKTQKNLFEELVSRDDVILTPHVGGWTFESYRKINEVLVSKIKDHSNSFV